VPLTPEQFSRLRQLWESVVDLPADQREAFVLQAAPGDPDLRQQVFRLLAAHESTDRIFDRPLVDHLGIGSLAIHPPLDGRVLGAYRVIRELGQGGMGTVYEAVRADDQFTKRVAIKTLRPGPESADLLRRFQRERQIQAALVHPNIATLLDAGVTGDGIPYIVLEYIDGVAIDEYAERHRLGLAARLDLFRQVTQAVQHAHRQLVVHRDLKPSNILVTPEGVVKLLDFGISKLLGDTTDQTATEGTRAFTTSYASPEQIRGQPTSTATDIYSLGVVLYQLLTGRVPFSADAGAPAATWVRICEEPPAPPSSVATRETAVTAGFSTPERLGRALRGELDAIVLMALRKEPDRRYPTADALGEDVLNHLRGLPVHARPDSAGYRVRKLVGRNRLAAAALGLAFLAMAAGTGISLRQVRVARRSAEVAEAARATADKERRTAQRTAEFLQEMFASADRSWYGTGAGAGATMADVVNAAAERIDRDLAEDPEVAISLHRSLSSNYLALRQFDKGRYHAGRELALLRQIGAPGPAVARGLTDLGIQNWSAGQLDTAHVLLREAYDLFEQAGFPEGEDLVLMYNAYGLLLSQMGRFPEAIPLLREGMAVNIRSGGKPAMTAVLGSNLGNALDATGSIGEAEQAFRAADAVLREVERSRGTVTFEQGMNLNNLGRAQTFMGRYAEAEATIREAIRILGETVGPDNASVGISLAHLARIQVETGRPQEALETVRQGAERFRPLPPTHQDHARVGSLEATILLALGRLEEAERRARHALAIRAALHPTDYRLAEARAILGRIVLARGRREEGITALSEGHQTLLASLGADHPLTIAVGRDLASARAAPGTAPRP